MSKGQPPVRQIKIRNEGGEGWTTIGGIWPTEKQDIFSCRLNLPDGQQFSAIIVPFEKKEPQPINEPAKAPTRSAARQRKPAGDQPRGAA